MTGGSITSGGSACGRGEVDTISLMRVEAYKEFLNYFEITD